MDRKRQVLGVFQSMQFPSNDNLSGCWCQETVGNGALQCGKDPEGIVWHSRDRRLYPMCQEHLDHNVRNRNGFLVGEI
jgi:hypothetical protein